MANDAHEDPAFQAMCREHEIEGTAQVALCGAFWNRALASTTGEAEPVAESLINRVSELMRGIDAYGYDYQKLGKVAGARHLVQNALLAALNADALKLARALCATPPVATPVAPGEVTDEQIMELRARKAYPVGPFGHIDFARDVLALSHPAPVAAPASPSVLESIEQLVSALAESKGWLRDYARALIEDAIDRRHLEVAAPAPASEAVAQSVIDDLVSKVRWLRSAVRDDCGAGASREAFNIAVVREDELIASIRALATPTPGDSADAPVQQAETKGGA